MKKFLSVLCLVLVINFSVGLASFAETVVFNTKTYKYHKVNCQWAQKCTKNCIKIDKKEAVKRGGVPCKVCGG